MACTSSHSIDCLHGPDIPEVVFRHVLIRDGAGAERHTTEALQRATKRGTSLVVYLTHSRPSRAVNALNAHATNTVSSYWQS